MLGIGCRIHSNSLNVSWLLLLLYGFKGRLLDRLIRMTINNRWWRLLFEAQLLTKLDLVSGWQFGRNGEILWRRLLLLNGRRIESLHRFSRLLDQEAARLLLLLLLKELLLNLLAHLL